MPMEIEKSASSAARKGASLLNEDLMKNSDNDLLEAIQKLPEDKKKQVAEFVAHLNAKTTKRPISDILKSYKGGQSFKTAEEVDAYIRAERDSWDR